MRDWLLVARVEELANPGDFLDLAHSRRAGGADPRCAGGLNAFANVCLHRGVEVAQGCGNAQRFSCPYHGWSYGLDGKLLGAPLMKTHEGFDPATGRLPRIALGNWGGNLFISFARDPVPFDDFIAPFQAEFGLLHQERCRLASKIEIDLDLQLEIRRRESARHLSRAGAAHEDLRRAILGRGQGHHLPARRGRDLFLQGGRAGA
ncbi:MAG: Rieske (2Fe-2S) protein [Pseudomonadota bacterium]